MRTVKTPGSTQNRQSYDLTYFWHYGAVVTVSTGSVHQHHGAKRCIHLHCLIHSRVHTNVLSCHFSATEWSLYLPKIMVHIFYFCVMDSVTPPEALLDDSFINSWRYTLKQLNGYRCYKHAHCRAATPPRFSVALRLSLIHIWRCRRKLTCRSRWSPYH